VTTEQLIAVLREFGFPAVVAVLVLWRFDGRLDGILRELRAIRIALAINGRRRIDDPPA